MTARGRRTLLLALALLGVGLAARYPVVAGAGAVLLALVVTEVLAVRSGSGVTARREIRPTVVVRDGTCVGTVHVAGRLRRGLVRTQVADRVGGTLVPVRLPLGPQDGEVTASYPVPTGRRGLHRVGPLEVARTSVTGMAATTLRTGDAVTLRVLPRRVPVRALVPGGRRAVSGRDDSLEVGGTDLIGLHEYAVGDDLRRLHWATSARTGTLMVRDDADPAEPHVCVVLDDRAHHWRDDPGEEFEAAVELAGGLCRAAAGAGSPLQLRFSSGREGVEVAGSPRGVATAEVRDVDWLLAEVEARPGPPGGASAGADLDVAVVVSGPRADPTDLLRELGDAPSRTVLVVDGTPGVSATYLGGGVVLRGPDAASLARLWEDAVGRP